MNPPLKSSHRMLATGFLLLVFIPFAGTWFTATGDVSLQENRQLAEAPDWSLIHEDFHQFTDQAEAWFADHFGFRQTFIRTVTRLKLALGITPTSQVMIAREDWLFLSSQRMKKLVTGATHFSHDELDAFLKGHLQRQQQLADMGMDYWSVIAPNKHTIYRHFLSGDWQESLGPTQLQQLQQVSTGQTHWIIPLAPLEKHKTENLYYQTDTHWTSYGAWLAYRDIIATLAKHFPAIGEPREVVIEERFFDQGDLSRMLGAQALFREVRKEATLVSPNCIIEETREIQPAKPSHFPVLISHCPNAQQPAAIIFRDSFMEALYPFLKEHFSTAWFIPSFYDSSLVNRILQQHQVDLVIEERAERMLAAGLVDAGESAPSPQEEPAYDPELH